MIWLLAEYDDVYNEDNDCKFWEIIGYQLFIGTADELDYFLERNPRMEIKDIDQINFGENYKTLESLLEL